MVFLADRPSVHRAPLAPTRPADEGAARRSLRDQIALIERQLADALVTGFPHEAIVVQVPGRGGPRMLGLGELEGLRDDLAARLQTARAELTAIAERRRQARLLLESMYADPRQHRFVRLPRGDLGLPGCGAYEVRPRLGVIGMLSGWWHVKLSSGCPRSARGEPAANRIPSRSPWAAVAANAL